MSETSERPMIWNSETGVRFCSSILLAHLWNSKSVGKMREIIRHSTFNAFFFGIKKMLHKY
jgi:hypothetical protein